MIFKRKRTQRAMVRAMFGGTIVDKKSTQEQINVLGLEETADGLAKANEVRWCGQVLKDDDSVLRMALGLEVRDKGK